MAKRQFKAESKRLLDLMINSIYTHKEIFLRELISNGSDAIDKLYYRSLSDGNTGLNRDDFCIRVEPDKDNRILRIMDNGMGMTKEEMEQNLGTIAKSGSLAFKDENQDDKADDIDIIGQFGVGFYSAFMVSDKVTVISRAFGEEQAHQWESRGADGYTMKESDKAPGTDLNDPLEHGTEIVLHLKEDTEDDKYGTYLDEYSLKGLVKRYSDYIRYPIEMTVEKEKLKEGSTPDDEKPEYEKFTEQETLNSMVPIWKKKKSELKDEDYNEFYKNKFMDFTDPLKVIHTSVEGVSTYDALLFIPGQAPFDYYSKEFEKGLQLYSSGVMIMEKCPDLLPDYFSFVRGIVDSQDLSLNISREMLQHDRQLKAIASRLEKKIKSELLDMMEKDREKYEKFFKIFGLQLKFGLYDKMGMYKENLQDLVMFYSSTEKKLVSLTEYVDRMKEDQTYIYYAAGTTVEKIDKLPQTELLKDKGFEILYLTDDIDEFALQTLREYKSKQFKSVSADDLDIESSEEKEESKKQEEDNKELLDFMKETLGDKVTDVRLSQRLKTHPVCLTTKGPVSLEMEKVLNQMPANEGIKAERILEINAGHDILKSLNRAFKEDKDKVKDYTNILYNQALLIEGMPIDDPVAYGNAVCSLMQ
ncbi:MAG: molecular chaperone HtpG [Eubacteriaceae bacterium]|nr:molecular chaperone HtpG [Eubacteriaceae bacterium]